ncbi:MAG: hypothetical protein JW818_03900 [Pirellulales bacterium]|nr:hypothetical protein [Pirellulales bacterium]
MATQGGNRRYPRAGERIAPATLRGGLLESVPERLARGTPLADARLCDLDDSAWEAAPAEVLHELAQLIVKRVAASCSRRRFDDRPFPTPPVDVTLEDLPLEHRTRQCLRREGYDADLGRLGQQTVGQVLQIRAFGPRCLVDLLAAVESRLGAREDVAQEIQDEARCLAQMADSERITVDDPRFGHLLQRLDPEARSAAELARRITSQGPGNLDPTFDVAELRRLREGIEALPRLTIEEELTQLFASTEHERNRQIVTSYYGWRDGRRRTLAQIGAQYGMTRERTRQICARQVKHAKPESLVAPVMDRVLAHLRSALPCPVDTLERDLIERGWTAVGLDLDRVLEGARLLGRETPCTVVRIETGRLAVALEQAEAPAWIIETAKRELYYRGLTTLKRVNRALQRRDGLRVDPRLMAEVIQLIDGFRWLDRRRGWFRSLAVGRHGLPRTIEKVLAVAGPVSVADLRAAVGRNRRMWKVPPPKQILLEYCRQTPGLVVDDRRIASLDPKGWREILGGVEKQLVEILERHGPVMERSELEERCVGSGMNRFSFHAFVAASPVIVQYGHSVYGLLGANVSRRAVQALVRRRRIERAPARVLDAHGRTADGRFWLRYRLSKAASTYAVVTIPSEWKETILGKFALFAEGGTRVGTLAAKDGRAWGLGAHLRRQGAQVGDQVLLTVDVDARSAVITLEATEPTPEPAAAELAEEALV